ncbi:non-ribosomal peptide synthetase [Rhodococcus sp. NPDC058514]|uniref:non-ribosomal peptide synthetase n=1 Tax=unclassified Rhodococcus (in: high G+C Gram-positive bacteria) TaxID=192944 RepID=UPI003657FE64
MSSVVRLFERPISPTERLYLAMQTLAPPFAIQLVVKGTGSIGEGELSAAVAGASESCPGARLVRRGERWVDSGVAPPVVVAADHTLADVCLDDHPMLSRPLDPEHGPTCEVLLLGPDRNTVVFRAFHGVMDGKGVHLWAVEVFRLLRGDRPVGVPDAVADHTLVESLGVTGKPTALIPTARSPFGRARPAPGESDFLWRRRTVDGTSPAVVARIAEVITAAVGGKTRIMVPVDLRRHDKDLRSTANLALPLFLDTVPGDGWSRIHGQLLRGMVESRELGEMNNGGLQKMPVWTARAILRTGMSIGSRTGGNLVSAIVSHTGTVDLDELSCPGFTADEAWGLPVHTGMVPLSIAVLEARGRTELVVSCRNGVGIGPRLERLLNDITGALGTEPSTPGPTVTSIFGDHVRGTPDAVAAIGPDGQLSYAELDARADVVAAELRGRGVRRGDVVAVLARRTLAGVVGHLGIIKAGGAFLALDPRHPDERILGILEDAGVSHCVIERALADRAAFGETDVLVVDGLPHAGAERAPDLATPDDLVYVTYTSGSTGRPKGVQVEHRGIVNLMRSATDWYRLGPDTRYAHYHTQAADMACAALLLPLLSGGAVVLVPDEINHLVLSEMLEGPTVNTMMVTPSLLEVVVRLGLRPEGMRTVSIGGEALHGPLAASARDLFGPRCRLLNSYGPAEMSIVCTAQVLDDEPSTAPRPVPIGVPAAGTTAHLLDAERRPVPDGEIGELYFGGPQVARGYLNRPDVTAERFVTLASGERCYRAGDLARRLPGGALEFAGRIDSQVKIRGNRVEPGEVQAAIEQHPLAARAAVVAVRRAERGDNILAAYVVGVAEEGTPELAQQLRAFLAHKVPAYMVPAEIHLVDEIPLTANGKLDGAALRADEIAPTADRKRDSVAPRAADEIAKIWAKVLVLDVSTLHADSDFFALGGDSLASVEMLSQVSRIVVGRDGEAAFVAELEDLVHHLTLGRVCAAALHAQAVGERG